MHKLSLSTRHFITLAMVCGLTLLATGQLAGQAT